MANPHHVVELRTKLTKEAEDLLAQGRTRAESKSFWCFCKSEKKRIIKAAEYYESAAKKFENLKEYERAAQVQLEQGELWGRIQEYSTRLHCMIEAAEFFEHCSSPEEENKALDIYEAHVNPLCEIEEFQAAVGVLKKIGR